MTTAEILSQLGITANYKGFLYIISAVDLCLEDQEGLHFVTKYVYPQVAKRHKTTWQAVERDIRKVVSLIWTRSRATLEYYARRPLEQRPGNAQFLAILTVAVGEPTLPEAGRSPLPYTFAP